MFQTLKRTMTEFSEDNLTDAAAALTYYAVLSIFPALLAMISIVGLVGDPQTIVKVLTDIVSSIGPGLGGRHVQGPDRGPHEEQRDRRHHGHRRHRVGAVDGVRLRRGVHARVERDLRGRGGPLGSSSCARCRCSSRSLLVVLLALVLVSLVLTGPIAKAVGSAVGVGDTAVTIWNLAKWPVLFVVVVFMITLLYYASPNAKVGGLKPILPGAALAIVVWLLASLAFAFYVANFGSYNKTYGALGGVIIFLVWLWLTNVAILLGAELNAERERSRQLKADVPGAEREIQLEERSQPKAKKRSRTA